MAWLADLDKLAWFFGLALFLSFEFGQVGEVAKMVLSAGLLAYIPPLAWFLIDYFKEKSAGKLNVSKNIRTP